MTDQEMDLSDEGLRKWLIELVGISYHGRAALDDIETFKYCGDPFCSDARARLGAVFALMDKPPKQKGRKRILRLIDEQEQRCSKPPFSSEVRYPEVTEWNNGVHSLARNLREAL